MDENDGATTNEIEYMNDDDKDEGANDSEMKIMDEKDGATTNEIANVNDDDKGEDANDSEMKIMDEQDGATTNEIENMNDDDKDEGANDSEELRKERQKIVDKMNSYKRAFVDIEYNIDVDDLRNCYKEFNRLEHNNLLHCQNQSRLEELMRKKNYIKNGMIIKNIL